MIDAGSLSWNLFTAAFAGLGFFGFYIAGKMHLFDQKGHTIKAWITIIPFTGAALIALTRVTDYRHHATDIIAGSLLGLGLAYFSYRLYYPPLEHPQAHKAYSPRIPAEEDPIDGENVYGDEEAYIRQGSDEGIEGTLPRPVDGRGQDPPIALRTASRNGTPAFPKNSQQYGSGRVVESTSSRT